MFYNPVLTFMFYILYYSNLIQWSETHHNHIFIRQYMIAERVHRIYYMSDVFDPTNKSLHNLFIEQATNRVSSYSQTLC